MKKWILAIIVLIPSSNAMGLEVGDLEVLGRIISERMDVSTHGKVAVIGFIDGSSQTLAFSPYSTYTWTAAQSFSSITFLKILHTTVTWQGTQTWLSSVTFSSATMAIAGNTFVWQSSAPGSGDLILHLSGGRIYFGGDNAVAGAGGGGGTIFIYDGNSNTSISTFTIPGFSVTFDGSFASITILASTPTWTNPHTFASSTTFSSSTINIGGIRYFFQTTVPVTGDQILHRLASSSSTYWGGDNAGAGATGGGDSLGTHIATQTLSVPNFAVSGSSITETGRVVAEGSATIRGIIISTTGFNVGASTVPSLTISGSSITFQTYTAVFASAPVQGEHLFVARVDGNRVIFAGGGDNAGAAASGGDSLGSHVTSRTIVNTGFGVTGSSIEEGGRLVFDGSGTIRGIIVSSTGFQVGASTVQGTFMVEGGTFQFRNGTNEFSINFASGGYSVGQHLIVSQIVANKFTIASGGDDTGTGGGGGGGSTLAVATGSAQAAVVITSPTAVINFDSSTFRVALTGGSTAFVAIGTNSVTTTGQTIRYSSSSGFTIWDTVVPREFYWSGAALMAISTGNSSNIAPIVKTTGTKSEVIGASYDDTAQECRGSNFIVPEYAHLFSTPTFTAIWYPSAKGGATGNVVWDFRYSSGITDSNGWDVALTTVVAPVSAGYAGANIVSSISWKPAGASGGGFTGAGTVSAMGWSALSDVNFLVCREGGNGSDTLVGDAVLKSFMISIPMR